MSHPTAVAESLAALSAAGAGYPDSPEAEKKGTAPRRERFLNLHEVAQVSLDSARAAFPALQSDFPIAWKQEVRHLRTRLMQMQVDLGRRQEQSLQVVAISSLAQQRTRHGLAANLAYMLASIQDQKVLLIDGRVGQAGLEAHLGLQNTQGLCEATRLKRDQLPQCLRKISGSQLYLMTSGQMDPFGLDPVDLRGLHLLLHGLRQHFDWIIVDAPAFDNPADAMILSQCADGTIFVLEREKDSFAALSKALGETQGRYLLGAVLV